MACHPQMVCGVFGEGCNRLVWVGSHRVQIGSDKKQYAPGDCARRTHSTCAHTLSQFGLRALTFALTGEQKRSEATLLRARVERVVMRCFVHCQSVCTQDN